MSHYKPHLQKIQYQWLITSLLLIVMVVTRSNYLSHIYDASWAIFFLVGFYYRSYIGLPIILLVAIGIDFAVISARGGHQDYYLTPSYLFVIPAYFTLWFAGRKLAHNYSENLKGLFNFIGLAVISIVACNLISSGGFYWMSTNVIELSLSEIFYRTIEFIPGHLQSTMIYLIAAALIHSIYIYARNLTLSQKPSF